MEHPHTLFLGIRLDHFENDGLLELLSGEARRRISCLDRTRHAASRTAA